MCGFANKDCSGNSGSNGGDDSHSYAPYVKVVANVMGTDQWGGYTLSDNRPCALEILRHRLNGQFRHRAVVIEFPLAESRRLLPHDHGVSWKDASAT